MTPEKLKILYHDNIVVNSKKLQKLKFQNKILTFLRLLFFSCAIMFLIFAIKTNLSVTYSILTVLSIVAFFIVLKKSIIISLKIKLCKNIIIINQQEEKALKHNFSSFNNGEENIDPRHPFSYDLDIFGEGSIFQQLNRTSSPSGRIKLASWLQDPLKEINEIIDRQNAIKELSGKIKIRQHFLSLGMEKKETVQNRNQIINWVKKSVSKHDLKYFSFISRVFSIVSILVFALIISSILPPSFLFILFAFNYLLISLKLKTINKEHIQVSKQYEIIMQFSDQIELLENEVFETTSLINLKNSVLGKEGSGSKSLKKLASIINSFDYRLNMLVGTILNGFFFWDFHSMLRLNKWKETNRDQLIQWFDKLDEFDAMQSLANFSLNNSSFVFPEFTTQDCILNALNLGHPQIQPEKRITNSIEIIKNGVFHIITGPNMAGKSTFLRTVGETMVLAQCGLPVCAERFIMNPVTLYSSMRTSDSLHKNESYFFAELKRLKEIISAIGQKENIFIILDEILKGTNSVDKAKGSKAFLKKITQQGATGIVATHDLSLGELELEFPQQILNYCFEAETEGDNVTFDYKLKRGITSKMNASVLMRKMGII